MSESSSISSSRKSWTSRVCTLMAPMVRPCTVSGMASSDCSSSSSVSGSSLKRGSARASLAATGSPWATVQPVSPSPGSRNDLPMALRASPVVALSTRRLPAFSCR